MFKQPIALAAVPFAAALLALPAAAQTAPTSPGGPVPDFNPRAESYAASIGAEFAQYRGVLATRRAQLSFGSGLATQDSTDLTTADQGGGFGLNSAWASLDAKQYNGTYSGSSASLIFGADIVQGNTLYGLIGGYNTSSVTIPTAQRIEAKGFSVGPYFATQLTDTLSLDGFIAFGKPDYNIDNGLFSGEKIFGNLTLTGSVQRAKLELTPFISIGAAREKLPAFSSAVPFPVVAYAPTKIKGVVATVGTGINYEPYERGGLLYLPRAGVEVDVVRNDDGFGNIADFATLRLSGGYTILGDTGGWSLGGDVARTSEGTTTIGASASYFWQF